MAELEFDGSDLIRMGLRPGPDFGRILDDLLDFVNPSSQVLDAGFAFPEVLNDNDQPVVACTSYSLSALDSYIELYTLIGNLGPTTISVLAGDWMNQGGELHVAQTPNIGVGPAITNQVGAMSFFGFGGAAGVDYSYTSKPPEGTNGTYVVISGVTVILHNANVLLALLGFDTGTAIDSGKIYSMTPYIGVGAGDRKSDG